MFSAEDIKNDDIFKSFIKNKELSASSKNVYAYRLKDFSDFTGKTPYEIIEDHNSGYFEKSIIGYIKSLRDEKKSELTIQNKLDTLRAFYSKYDIIFPSYNDFKEETEFEEEIPNKSHVKKALQLINKRDKAIILLQFTSGISPKILRNLTYGDFIKAMEDYIPIKEIDVIKIKKIVNYLSNEQELIGKWRIIKKPGEIFYSFNTTESSRAILEYLMYREINNKHVKKLEDPLFVNRNNIKLKKSTYDGIFTRINTKADFKHLDSNKRFFTSNNLKKSFRETLKKSGADKTMIDAISGLKSIIKWDKENVENFKINYKRNSRFFIIEENDIESLKTKLERNDDELRELKDQIKYLRHLLAQEKK